MSLGNQSPPLLNHLKELPLTPGQDPGSLSSLHRLKRISLSLRYEALYCKSEILFQTFLSWSHGMSQFFLWALFLSTDLQC
jgi:hypothetical protein